MAVLQARVLHARAPAGNMTWRVPKWARVMHMMKRAETRPVKRSLPKM